MAKSLKSLAAEWNMAHCPSSSKRVPGGNTGEVKGGEEGNWPPCLTMPPTQDKSGTPKRTE